MTMPSRPVFSDHAKAGVTRLRQFGSDLRGTVSVEAALITPFLMALFAVSFVWFDAFRAKNSVLKATYTVADMISRETTELPATYFAGLNTVFAYMATTGNDARLRITAFKCTKDCDDESLRELEMCWSWASGSFTDHTDETSATLHDYIPLMVLGDTVVVTEGALNYDAAFDILLEDILPTDQLVLSNTIVTRPRFAPQISTTDESCY